MLLLYNNHIHTSINKKIATGHWYGEYRKQQLAQIAKTSWDTQCVGVKKVCLCKLKIIMCFKTKNWCAFSLSHNCILVTNGT
jgi:hypothetical protein